MPTPAASPKLFAFVLMPFEAKFDDIYRLGIKEAAEGERFTAERVDEQKFYQEPILQRIYNQIDLADVIIADMSGRNPNVFYGVGYAHAKKKICILLTASADDIPFDLKHHRHVVYGTSIKGLRDKLSEELRAVGVDLLKKGNPITITLQDIKAVLSKTKWSADVTVNLYIDLHNYTEAASPEIEAVYFYTGKGWKFTQDGQECPHTKSDLPNLLLRHLVKSPLRRLQRGGWAQIKITGEKTVANTFRGEELQDKYKLTGWTLLRVSTSEGTFDEKLNLNIEADEFPF